jgi:hypothetical protein
VKEVPIVNEALGKTADPMEQKALEVIGEFEKAVGRAWRRARLVPKGRGRFAVALLTDAPEAMTSWPATTLEFDRIPESPELLARELCWAGNRPPFGGLAENFDGQGHGSLGWALARTGIVTPARALAAFPLEVLLGTESQPGLAGYLAESAAEGERTALGRKLLDRLDREARLEERAGRGPGDPGVTDLVLRALTGLARQVNDTNAPYADLLLEWLERHPLHLDAALLRTGAPSPGGHPWSWTADRFWDVFVDTLMLGDLPREKRARDAGFILEILGNPELRRTLIPSLDQILSADDYLSAQVDLLVRSRGYASAADARRRLGAARGLDPSANDPGNPEPAL